MKRINLLILLVAAILIVPPVARAASPERFGTKYYYSMTAVSASDSAAGRGVTRRVYVPAKHDPFVLFLEAVSSSEATVAIAVTDVKSVKLYHESGGAFVSATIKTDGGVELTGYLPASFGIKAIRTSDLHSSSPIEIAIRISSVEKLEFATKAGDIKDGKDYRTKIEEAAEKVSDGTGTGEKEPTLDNRLDEIEATLNRTHLVNCRKKLLELEEEVGLHYRIDYLLARAFLRRGYVDQAIERLKRSIATEPKYAPALFLKLIMIYESRLYPAALELAREILELAPGERVKLETMYIASQCAYRTDSVAKANSWALKMLDEVEDPRAYAMLAQVQMRLSRWKNARGQFEKALVADEKRPWALDTSAVYNNLGALDEIDAMKAERKSAVFKGVGDEKNAALSRIEARNKYYAAAENYRRAIIANYFLKEAELNLQRLEDAGRVTPRTDEEKNPTENE